MRRAYLLSCLLIVVDPRVQDRPYFRQILFWILLEVNVIASLPLLSSPRPIAPGPGVWMVETEKVSPRLFVVREKVTVKQLRLRKQEGTV